MAEEQANSMPVMLSSIDNHEDIEDEETDD